MPLALVQYGNSPPTIWATDADKVTVVGEVNPLSFSPSHPRNGTPLDWRKLTRSGEYGVKDGPMAKIWSRSTSFSAAARVRLASPESSSTMYSNLSPLRPPLSLM